MQRSFTVLVVLFLALLVANSAVAQVPELTASWAEATSYEEKGDFSKAAEVLAPQADRYPDDFALNLQVAWDYFRAGDFARAEHYYRRADALTESPGVARLGLGWTELRLGKLTAARVAFESYLAANPGSPANAREGLAEVDALAEIEAPTPAPLPASWWIVRATPAIGHVYLDHAAKDKAYGAGLGVEYTGGMIWASASYGYVRFDVDQAANAAQGALAQTSGGRDAGGSGSPSDGSTPSETGSSNGGSGDGSGAAGRVDTFGEHTVMLGLGVGGKVFGASAHAAYVQSDGDLHSSVFAGGLVMRLSVLEDLYAGGTYSKIDGETSLDGALSWDIEFLPGWWVTPAGLLQSTSARGVMGGGALSLSRRAGSLRGYVKGRFGRFYHDVDFAGGTIAGHHDDVTWGASAGMSVWPTERWSVGIFGATEAYENRGQDAGQGVFVGATMTFLWIGE